MINEKIVDFYTIQITLFKHKNVWFPIVKAKYEVSKRICKDYCDKKRSLRHGS